jgi:hypothetical protein
MRVLILTQPIGHNYGGIMQAYALQRFLRGLGHEVQTLDYRLDERRNLLKTFIRAPRSALREFRRQFLVSTHHKIPRDFVERRIALTKTYYPVLRISDILARSFDCFVVGSDQCWRPKWSPHLPTFFLDFLEQHSGVKRIAYGASFGTDEWELSDEMTDLARRHLQRFDFLSVRESSAVDLCKNHLGLTVSQVVDPVLLFDASHYIGLIREEESIRNDGEARMQDTINPTLLTYFLDPDESIENIAREASGKLELKRVDLLNSENERTAVTSVGDWMRGFYNANYVLTDSFHGLVFSLIFQKQFLVIENVARGGARFRSLINALGLSDRVITRAQWSNSYASEILSRRIDWARVNRLLEDQRRRSREALRAAVGNSTKHGRE